MLYTEQWLALVNDALSDARFNNYPLYYSLLAARREFLYMILCDSGEVNL